MSNNSNNLIITQAAAARILSKRWGYRVDPWMIVMEPWACGIRCRVPNHRPIILSRKAFTEDFADYRKEGAKSCRVEAPLPGYPAQYRVKSRSRDGRYHSVWLSGSVQTCSCEDYRRQKEAWGKGCCSHLIAVIDYLGFNSFSEAVSILKDGQKSWNKFTKRARQHYPGLNPVSLSEWEEAEHKDREHISIPSSGISIPANDAYSGYVREEVRQSYF